MLISSFCISGSIVLCTAVTNYHYNNPMSDFLNLQLPISNKYLSEENVQIVPKTYRQTSSESHYRRPHSLNDFNWPYMSPLNQNPSIHHERSQRTSSQKDSNLRVVFQYKGLLEADPTSGSYKKVIPNRLVNPIKADPNTGSYNKIIPKSPVDSSNTGGYKKFIPKIDSSSVDYLRVIPDKGSGKLVTWRPALQTTNKPTTSWKSFLKSTTELSRNKFKVRTTTRKPKTTTRPWNLTPIKTWTNPWEGSEASSLDLQPSSSTYSNDNIVEILPVKKVTSQKPKDRISFSDLKKIVTWSPSWKNKNSIDDNENSIEDLIPTYSTVEADENKPRGDFDTFSEIEIDEKNKIDVENVAGLKDDSDEEVDKVNDEIPFPTIMNNETKLLNWSDNPFDNSDDEINTYSIKTNKEDIYSPDQSTTNSQDNLITLQDDFDIIGKAVTFIDDNFNSEDPIPLDDVFPTR